jgi:integron integrase
MRTPWPEIDGRTPLALLTPPPELWRSLWPSDLAMGAAVQAEHAQAAATAARSEARAGVLSELRRILRTRRYSPRTESAYVVWGARFLASLGPDLDPAQASWRQAAAFIGRLATEQAVVASTQNQAFAALRLLFRDVLKRDADEIERIPRARLPSRLPQILTRGEVTALIAALPGALRLMAALMYGCGLRVSECCGLRVRDLDFAAGELLVRGGKGLSDRIVPLPGTLRPPLALQLSQVRAQHAADRRAGWGSVDLPPEVERRSPLLRFDPAWQWSFPARRLHLDRPSGEMRRRPLHPSALQAAFQRARRAAGLARPATCHTLRHCFATHLVDDGVDVRTVQELLGHRHLSSTMVYVHRPADGVTPGTRVRSPLDEAALALDTSQNPDP